jgi:hypothetical protein
MGKARRRKDMRNKAQKNHFEDEQDESRPACCTGQHQQAPAATVAVAHLPTVQGAVAALQLADNTQYVDWSALPMEALQNVLSFVSLTQRLCRQVTGRLLLVEPREHVAFMQLVFEWQQLTAEIHGMYGWFLSCQSGPCAFSSHPCSCGKTPLNPTQRSSPSSCIRSCIE